MIALLWRDVAVGVLDVAGISLEPGAGLATVGIFVIAALAVTIVIAEAIVVVSRWSGAPY